MQDMTPPTPPARSPRASRKRSALVDLLAGLESFSSAQEIHRALRQRGETVGLSTVYRNLQALAETGDLDTLRHEDGEVLYRKCGDRHHHHLVCRTCGRVVEVTGPAVERWAEAAATEHGFADVAHTVEIFGVCSECREA